MSLETEIKKLTEMVTELNATLKSGRVTTTTEPVAEATNAVTVDPEPTKDKKEPSQPRKVSLDDLKAAAQSAVTRSDRATVKGVIGKYADKLTNVKQQDFFLLMDELASIRGDS